MVKYAPRKVFIKESGRYVELSYMDFCRRRESDQTYMDKLFIPIQGNFRITLQIIFIHVLIRFYAVLEECMPVEENLRKILMMLEELAQQSLQVKLLIYFI